MLRYAIIFLEIWISHKSKIFHADVVNQHQLIGKQSLSLWTKFWSS